MNDLNKPFDRILKARAIMERVNRCLAPLPEAAPEDAPVVLVLPQEAANIDIDPDLCFSPEADGTLEVTWAAPVFVPCWARPGARKFSELDMDEFTKFQGAEYPLPEAVFVEVITDGEDAATEEIPPPVIAHPEPFIEPKKAAPQAAPRTYRFGQKAAIAAVSAAAMVLLVLSIFLGTSPKSAPIVLNVEESAPLVDLNIEPEIQPTAAEVVAVPEAIEFITSEELLAEEKRAPAPVKKRPSESYALDLELALFPQTPVEPEKPKPALLKSVERIIASPTLATISEELGIAPSAGGDEEDYAAPLEPLYTLSAFPDRLTVGQATDVVFTLRREGQALAIASKKIRFENNPAFPNLRDIARYPNGQGTFTVKGLRPDKAGVAALRLHIDDIYVDAPLYVAAPGVSAPAVATASLPIAPSAASSETESIDIETELAAAPLAPLPPPQAWIINPGLLRGQLEAWSARAGYQLVWEAKNDFEMFSQASFEADYIGAVTGLFSGMHAQGNPLRVTVYQGNRVLKVTED